MLLRICLALAILAGAGVIAVTQFILRPQIENIRTEREHNKQQWVKFEGEARKLRVDLKNTQAKLDTTEKTLESTRTELASASAKAATESTRANKLQKDLEGTTTQLKTAQQDLAAWNAVGLKVEEVRGLNDMVKNLRNENETLKIESGVLHKKIKALDEQIAVLTKPGDSDGPPVPPGLKGKVLVVDPKWDFLVLDIGANKEVPKDGVMLVSRNGKLVAKVRITSVQPERSIANIIPGWKLDDVSEGDMVLALR